MHEIGLVEDIISAINAKLSKGRENAQIKKVNIAIGELEHISPEHFEFHFKERTKGTVLENAELNFKKAEAMFKCKDCGAEFSAKRGMKGCPKCNCKVNDIVKGMGVYIESVEME